MLRCLSVTMLFALALTLAGCGSSSELPPKNDAGPTMSKQDTMKKAMQGMPPEMQKKMMGQMKK
jgi:predicted small lipoprotein YifL